MGQTYNTSWSCRCYFDYKFGFKYFSCDINSLNMV